MTASWLVLSGAARADAPVGLTVEDVSVTPAGLRLDVALPDGLPADLLGRLDEGERVEVAFQVEVFRDRRWWFNSTLAKVRVELGARFDPVTRRYALDRSGGGAEHASEAGERRDAVGWLTRIDALTVPLDEGWADHPRLRYRVRAVLDRRLFMLVVPTTVRSRWVKGELGEGGP